MEYTIVCSQKNAIEEQKLKVYEDGSIVYETETRGNAKIWRSVAKTQESISAEQAKKRFIGSGRVIDEALLAIGGNLTD